MKVFRNRTSLTYILKLLAFTILIPSISFAAAFVRVNQVGYPANGSKPPYLMPSGGETGATFAVKNSRGTTLFSGPIGGNLGSWSTSYPDVYALDFPTVTAAGTYTIIVSGPIAASSPTFKIDSAANVYSNPLANSLFFYQNERDGPNFIASPLRTAAGHVNDQSATVYITPSTNNNGRFSGDLKPVSPATVIDASGGWWDAGDYLKFVQTTSYTLGVLLIGARDFPNQMGAGSSDFTAEGKFGLDWMHDIWRLPQADDTYGGCTSRYRYICHRPVFISPASVNSSGQVQPNALISPNLAGRVAADFALCYHAYRTSNTTYANQCLLSAEHIFDLANTAPSGNLLTVIPFSFYPESEWRDDLEWGAVELYFALQGATGLPTGLPHTDPNFYLQQAAHWANAYITGPNDAADTLNLYDVTGLAHFELYRALTLAGNPNGTGLETNQAALLGDLQKQLNKVIAQTGADPFGFGFPWNTYDTTSHGAGLAVMAAEYTFLNGPALNGGVAAADYANRQLANILGANAWGTSLIGNDGSTFPLCMQHQVTNLVPTPPNGPPFLSGAAVEGPNSIAAKGTLSGMVACPPNGVDVFAQFNGKAVYKDFVQSYSTVEPAIDLTASSPLAFAWQIAGAPSGTP